MYSPFVLSRSSSLNGSLSVKVTDSISVVFCVFGLFVAGIAPFISKRFGVPAEGQVALQITFGAIAMAAFWFRPVRTYVFDVQRQELRLVERKWFRKELFAWALPFSQIDRVWLAYPGPETGSKKEFATLMLSTRDQSYALGGVAENWLVSRIVGEIEQALKATSVSLAGVTA